MYQLGIKEENELLICYRGMYIPVNLCDFLKNIDYSQTLATEPAYIYIYTKEIKSLRHVHELLLHAMTNAMLNPSLAKKPL